MAATTTEGRGPGSVYNVKPRILNGVVKTENIDPGTVIESDVRNGSITNSKLSTGSVTVSKMKVFKSTQQTGTGSSQSIAHGLGSVPGLVMVYPADTGAETTGEYVMTEGTHTSTNVVVTVTNGKKFIVVAIA
jgi:hypothetical protein